ncbi:MAG: hypothetical protein KKA31_03375, partial [Candidatus Margulisbacteria bacterium]|nr:hypothetical protein [Candidatus Margulisiibacteriota bacterium]
KFSVISMSGNLINEVPYMMLGGAWRAPAGVIGIGYVGASTDGIKEAILVGSTPEVTGNTANFGATTFVLSYANEAKEINYINKINFLTDRNAKVGANFKLVSQGFSGGASFEGGSASGFDVDLGTIIPINETMNSSVTIKNIIPGNNVGKDELPMSIIGGLSVKYPERNLLTAYDAEMNQEGFLLHLGIEWNPTKALFVRAGIDQKADAYNLALGLGTKFKGFTFDYAYHTYAEMSEFTTHYFSIGFAGPEMATGPEPKPPVVERTPAPAAPAAPAEPEMSPMAKKIQAYITTLEGKLAGAKEPARIAKLKQLIAAEKVRLAKEIKK